jgi:hypothetical protein
MSTLLVKWFRSANSHTGPPLTAASKAGQMAASDYRVRTSKYRLQPKGRPQMESGHSRSKRSGTARVEEMQIGDRIKVDRYACTVVALLKDQAFASDYPASEWAYLKEGILVVDDQAGLLHYRDLTDVWIEHLDG